MEQSHTNDFNRLSIIHAALTLRLRNDAEIKRQATRSKKDPKTITITQALDPRFIILKNNLNPQAFTGLHNVLAYHGGDPADCLN